MMVKEKGRREAHLHESSEQLVGKEGCKVSFLMHYVVQECGVCP